MGQRAVTTTEDYLKGKRRSSGVGRRQTAPESETEAERMEEDEDE